MSLEDLTTQQLQEEIDRRDIARNRIVKRFTAEGDEIVSIRGRGLDTFSISKYYGDDDFESDSADEDLYFAMDDLPKLISIARAFQSAIGE